MEGYKSDVNNQRVKFSGEGSKVRGQDKVSALKPQVIGGKSQMSERPKIIDQLLEVRG